MTEGNRWGKQTVAVAFVTTVALALGLVGLLPAAGQTTPVLMVSNQADRTGGVPLASASVAGDVYVLLEGVATGPVDFWIDDPEQAGPYDRRERSAPFDLVGGTKSTAKPLDADGLGGGTHAVSAQYPGGMVSALFDVVATTPTASHPDTLPPTAGPGCRLPVGAAVEGDHGCARQGRANQHNCPGPFDRRRHHRVCHG